MTEKRSKSPASAAKGRRKHAAPTIDLTATEVQAQEAPQETSQESQHEPQQDAPAVQEPVAPESVEQRAAATEPTAPESSEHVEALSETRSPEPSASDDIRPPSGGHITGAVLGGVVGAAIMALVLGGLWLSGVLPGATSGSSVTQAQLPDKVAAQIAALEKQVGDLRQRLPEAAANGAGAEAVAALSQRVAKIEDSIKSIPAGAAAANPALLKRVAEAENAMKSLGVALTALNRRSDEIATKAAQANDQAAAAEKSVTELRASLQDVSKTAKAGASSVALEQLQKRIAGLEQSAKAANDKMAKIAVAASAPDTSARLALSAAALRDAVVRGQPYAQELTQAKSLGANDKTLAPLARFAPTGVPSNKVLAKELSALMPAMMKTVGPQKPAGGFLEKLQANAERLVRIRPVNAPPGNDAPAVLARIETEIAKADIAGALADIGKLPEPARQVAADWVTRASARQQALAAARQFAAASAHALGSK